MSNSKMDSSSNQNNNQHDNKLQKETNIFQQRTNIDCDYKNKNNLSLHQEPQENFQKKQNDKQIVQTYPKINGIEMQVSSPENENNYDQNNCLCEKNQSIDQLQDNENNPFFTSNQIVQNKKSNQLNDYHKNQNDIGKEILKHKLNYLSPQSKNSQVQLNPIQIENNKNGQQQQLQSQQQQYSEQINKNNVNYNMNKQQQSSRSNWAKQENLNIQVLKNIHNFNNYSTTQSSLSNTNSLGNKQLRNSFSQVSRLDKQLIKNGQGALRNLTQKNLDVQMNNKEIN
ncbi:hypothetical protein PPERSA_07145 [Pseudocohnilembus persalinus]|uniref:Uncharacterized protein n=1 Tax=Pseudocohnilembus persalinus TaxID=266149 RepID=A0A0V0QXL9_PSEPJ|nr:hypothetical protein PPERSA_07145 [Pseudocohnilembus persalinus]|eukprot:KRX06982.1 hypothetical protein PPERSA_07145 [Pseudocohnilembus persalinus]